MKLEAPRLRERLSPPVVAGLVGLLVLGGTAVLASTVSGAASAGALTGGFPTSTTGATLPRRFPSSTLAHRPAHRFPSSTLAHRPAHRFPSSTLAHRPAHRSAAHPSPARSKYRSLTPAQKKRAKRLVVQARLDGNTMRLSKIRQMIKQGHRGPMMHYMRGYGMGNHGGPPGLIPLAHSMPSPSEAMSTVSQTAGMNGALAVLLVFLVGLPAIVFNSALKAHQGSATKSHGRIYSALRRIESWLENLHGVALMALFAAVGAVLYALDDPTFGLNLSSLAEILGYMGAIVIATTVTEVARGIYVHRKFKKVGQLKAFPMGILIAIVFVAFSRLTQFEPGYVFGILMAIVFRVEPTLEENGRSMTYSALWQLGLATAAWFAWIPVKDLTVAGNSSFLVLTGDSLLAFIWICGLQSLFFGLMPVRYMDGETIFRWSKAAWFSLYAVVTFIFVQFIMHPSAAGWGGNKNASLLPMLSIFIVSGLAAGIYWLYVRHRYGSAHLAAATATSSDTQAAWGGYPSAWSGYSPVPASSTVPAAWFPDPTGRHQHRYWDGGSWTHHVADSGIQGIDYI